MNYVMSVYEHILQHPEIQPAIWDQLSLEDPDLHYLMTFPNFHEWTQDTIGNVKQLIQQTKYAALQSRGKALLLSFILFVAKEKSLPKFVADVVPVREVFIDYC